MIKLSKFPAQNSGFSVIEVILAGALFLVFATGLATVAIQAFRGNRLGGEQTIATQYAAEGIEAARSLKNQAFSNLNSALCSSGAGLQQTGGVWTFKASGTSDSLQNYTRVIKVCDVQRDGSGNIVSSGGTVDPLTKKVTSTVTWNTSPTRGDSVVLNEYFTNWKLPLTKGGMIVYANGSGTTDDVQYRVLDSSTGNWSTAASVADVDTGSTNKVPRAVRLYASATRNEKVLVTRNFNGLSETIYAQVYDGSNWGNVVQLASWLTVTTTDIQNFDGAYLNNGDFMVAYSDNTNIPKMRTWNGSVWSAQISMQTAGGVPNQIVMANRTGTNELMFATMTQNNRTATQYFNGGSYATASWVSSTTHATNTVNAALKVVDFAWSITTPTQGLLVFSGTGSDKAVDGRLWTANGSGGGSWSGTVQSTTQANNIGDMNVVASPVSNQYMVCTKNSVSPASVTCYQVSSSPAFSNPTNQVLTTSTDTGTERSYHTGYELNSGATGLAGFSDSTNIPKLKKYTAGTTTWASSPISVGTGSFTLGTLKAFKLIPREGSDDIMVLMGDANTDIYSVFWDGTADAPSNTGGYAFTQHGTQGTSVTGFWFDFVWDKF